MTLQKLMVRIGAAHAFRCPHTIRPWHKLGPDDLGMDSLEIAGLAMSLEDEYSIEIHDEDWRKWETVQDVWDYLEAVR